MTRSTTYEHVKPTALALSLLVASTFSLTIACGDDDDSPAPDGGTDERSDAVKDGKGGAGGSKAGAGGSKAGAGESKAGAGGGEAGAGGEDTARAGKGGNAAGASVGGAGGAKSSAGAGGSPAPAGVTVTGVVVDASNGTAERNFDSTKYPVVPGVKVCVYDKDSIPCVTTDAEGKYTLSGLPEGLDVYLAYTKDSLAPTLFKPVASRGNEMPAILMPSTAYRDSFAQAGGIAPDANAGLIYFGANLLENRGTSFHQKFGNLEIYYLRGYSVSVAPAPKAGPVYVADNWAADAALTKSSKSGWGLVQALPGDYKLTFTHPAVTCPQVTTKVVKGWVTLYAGTVCSPGAEENDAGI